MVKEFIKIISIFIILIALSFSSAVATKPLLCDIYVDDNADPSWYDLSHVKTIQEGITNVTSGGFVFVYNGTYYENILITKRVTLMGESSGSTIIDGMNNGDAIIIETNNVTISRFTIQNATSDDIWERWAIKIKKGFNPALPLHNFTISECIIKEGKGGILLHNASNCQVSNCSMIDNNQSCLSIRYNSDKIIIDNCIFSTNGELLGENAVSPGGLRIDGYSELCENIEVKNCTICSNIGIGLQVSRTKNITIEKVKILKNSWMGLYVTQGVQNVIARHNDISDNRWNGIYIIDETDRWGSTQSIQNIQIINNIIQNNSYNLTQGDGGILLYNCIDAITLKHNNIISNNGYGILCSGSKSNVIVENNFIKNSKNAFFSNFAFWNQWDSNYWDDWKGIVPKIISGKIGSILPWFNIDWHPANEEINF